MKFLLIFLILMITSISGARVIKAAHNLNLVQLIVPLNCVFDYVDDGSNTIYYVTPEICEPPLLPSPTGNNTVIITKTVVDQTPSVPQITFSSPSVKSSDVSQQFIRFIVPFAISLGVIGVLGWWRLALRRRR